MEGRKEGQEKDMQDSLIEDGDLDGTALMTGTKVWPLGCVAVFLLCIMMAGDSLAGVTHADA